MRKELEQIEKIERYIAGELNGAEKAEFESQLSYDSALNEELQLQKEINGALDRKILKAEISQGLKQYNKNRNLKRYIAGAASIAVIGTSLLFISPEKQDNIVQKEASEKYTIITSDEAQLSTPEAAPKIDTKTKSIASVLKTKGSIKPLEAVDVYPIRGKNINTNVFKLKEKPADSEATVKSENLNSYTRVTEKVAVADTNAQTGTPTAEAASSIETTSNAANNSIIPNAFTPNNDGINDVFKINIEGVTDLKCTIFNLKGEKIYEWNDVNGFWDGKVGSEKAQGNVYIYNLRTKAAGAQDFGPVQIGTITVIR